MTSAAKDMVKDLHTGDNLEELMSCLVKSSLGLKEMNDSETVRTALSMTNFLPLLTAANKWTVHADCSLPWHRKKSDRRISTCLLCVQTNTILEENQTEKILNYKQRILKHLIENIVLGLGILQLQNSLKYSWHFCGEK
jgi:hypothetical protein